MPTNPSLPGLHHVTAITADAKKNIDFYRGVLGLRLVKLTVNFDDPTSYHLYYGDALGRPGTILTFFAWPGAHPGRVGPPQVAATAFAVPAAALEYWSRRLKEESVQVNSTSDRFGQHVLAFADPDGLALELIGVTPEKQTGEPWSAGPIPVDYAIRGFHSVSLWEEGHEKTSRLLTDVMGFTAAGDEQNRYRYVAEGAQGSAGAGDFAATVDLLCVPGARRGELGAGVVHHVAFRTPDDAQQTAWRTEIASAGLNVSPIMDRIYFHSIYYREPGGVLFEIATNTPGFTIDERPEQLGRRLMLPPWLEKHRAAIERAVPSLLAKP